MYSMHRVLAATLFLFLHHASAHTWNEQLAVIGGNGSYTGAYGYPRGYVSRVEPQFDGESNKYQLPSLESGRTRINASDLLCHPAQRTQNQTAGFPRLSVAPGSAVAMKYLENGHVSKPYTQAGKPPKGGTVFVFGTTQPYDDETLLDVLQWTADGSGGDKRGRLLVANNYDDGRCHQISDSAISVQRQSEYPDPFPGQPGSINELWCETDVVLPSDASIMPVGELYTIYWVWQWPTEAGVPDLPEGKDEYYMTCSDFEVVADEPTGPLTNLLTQQDPNTVAVSGYLSRTAITPTPVVQMATEATWTFSSWATYVPSAVAVASPTTSSVVAPSTLVLLATSTPSPVAVPTSAPLATSTPLMSSQTPASAMTSQSTSFTTVTSINYRNTTVTSFSPIATSSRSLTTLTLSEIPLPGTTAPVSSSAPTSILTLTVIPTAAAPSSSVPVDVPSATTSSVLATSMLPSATTISSDAPMPATAMPVTMTGYVTVVATLLPGQQTTLSGLYNMTFMAPETTVAETPTA